MFFTRSSRLLALLPLFILCACQKPQGLQFTGFSNFSFAPVSFTNSRISLGIGVFNPNHFDIKVGHVEADINLAGTPVGRYQLDSTFLLKGGEPFVLPVTLTVKNSTLLGNAFGLLAGDSIPYSLNGRVKAGRKIAMAEIPFTYSGHLSQKDFNLAP